MRRAVKKLGILALSAFLMLSTFMMNMLNINATMQPIEEINAFLVLTEEDETRLKNFPVSEMLGMLQAADGSYISIDSDAKVVWTYFKDDEGNVLRDEYHEIDRNETADLTVFGTIGKYRMELIVGSSDQLDTANKRYIVKVILFENEYDTITFDLYKQDDAGNRTKVIPDSTEETLQEAIGMEYATHVVRYSAHQNGDYYYLGVHSEKNENPNIKVQVFTFADYIRYLNPETRASAVDIADQIFCDNMQETNKGFRGQFRKTDNIYEAVESDGTLFFVYENTKTGETVTSAQGFFVVNDFSNIEASVNIVENGVESDATVISNLGYDPDENELIAAMSGANITAAQGTAVYSYMLKEGLSVSDNYYVYLQAHGVTYGDDANSYVVKAVEGLYKSIDEVGNLPDIKDQLIPASRTANTPYGYLTNCDYRNGGKYFTVFFEDGSVFRIQILFMEYDPSLDPDYMREFTDEPIVGERDPWFRVTGLMLDGQVLDTYVIENGKAINMDTYYGYGYQTIMVNRVLSDDEKSRLVPIFELQNEDRLKVRLIRGSEQTPLYSGETVVDFNGEENGLVHLVLDFDNNTHVKNYQLRVLSKESGPSLYVYDDHKETVDGELVRSREVLLTDYFENKHDILVANIGDQALTGLNVTLEPIDANTPMNVKLDDYWTIGGAGNDTLRAFVNTTDKSAYGMIQNLAKIRLLPDGDGEINAKLVIKADGQDDIVVYLSDHARQPKVINGDALPNGVRWVPYSAYIVTDNMYDWNTQTFSIDEGDLPAGLELYNNTGEIYGVPQEAGEFTIHAHVHYSRDDYFEDSEAELKLVIEDNTDTNVYNASDEEAEEGGYNYLIKQELGVDQGGYHYVLEDVTEDQVFTSWGEYEDFVDLWLNGEKLVKDVDYIYESGSTVITIRSQTFDGANTGNEYENRNTIAMEFRNKQGGNNNGGDHKKDLRRTSQNFYIVNQQQVTPEPQPDPQPVLPPYVVINGTVVDEQNQPMADVIVELHSKVQTATADANGKVKFTDVEYGAHTAYIKDKAGKELGTVKFTLVEGSKAGRDGSTITAPRGSAVNITMKISSAKKSAEIDDVKVETPNTADHSNAGRFLYILFGSLFLGIAAFILRNKAARK